MKKKSILYFMLILTSIYIWLDFFLKLPSIFGSLDWVIIGACLVLAFIPQKSKENITKIDTILLVIFLLNLVINSIFTSLK